MGPFYEIKKKLFFETPKVMKLFKQAVNQQV